MKKEFIRIDQLIVFICISLFCLTFSTCSSKEDKFTEGISLYKSGNYTACIEKFLDCYDSTENSEALFMAARSSYILGNGELLNDVISRADESVRYFEDILYLYAKYCYEQGDYSKAENIIGTVIKRDPDNIKIHFLMGKIAEDQGDYNKALKNYNKITALYPYFLEIHTFFDNYYKITNNKHKSSVNREMMNSIIKYKKEFYR